MIGRQFSTSVSIASITTTKKLVQLCPGTAVPIWLNYISVDGNSDTADGMQIDIIRQSAACTGTSLSGLIVPWGQTAGTVEATQMQVSTTTSAYSCGTTGTDDTAGPIWTRQGSVQSGGGLSEWFPEGAIVVKGGGFLVVKSAITITSATLTCTLIWSEIG